MLQVVQLVNFMGHIAASKRCSDPHYHSCAWCCNMSPKGSKNIVNKKWKSYVCIWQVKTNMAAIINRSRAPFPWNEWNPKKKMLLILMMLVDEEDSIMLNRKIWCRHWLLRREERGAYHTIFRELKILPVSLST